MTRLWDRTRLALTVTGALVLASCGWIDLGGDDEVSVRRSGTTVVRSFDVASFDAVSVGNAFTATLTRADEHGVAVTIDDNLVDYLAVEVRSETLYVDLDGVNSVRGAATLEARITLPELVRLDLSGASRGRLEGFTGEHDLEVRASGASTVSGELSAGELRLDLSGASTAALAGDVQNADLRASGSSRLDLSDLVIAVAKVELSGASRAEVQVTGEIARAVVSGASTLR